MKNQLLHLCTYAVFLALTSIAFADPLVPPVREMEIPFIYEDDIVIDGTTDNVYGPEQTTEVFNPTGNTGEDADFTVTFRVAYNIRYLYIYCEIWDDFDNSIQYSTSESPETYDNIEIFINLDTTGTVSAYDTNTIQLRINRGIDSIQSPGRATQDEYIHHWENTATGWLFETAIPWICVLAESQNSYNDILNYLTTVNGFDLHGNDSDELGPDHLDCQTAWDSDGPSDPDDRTEGGAGTDPTLFGIFTFELCDDCSAPPWDNVNLISENQVLVYPNPAGSIIHFEMEGVNLVRIYSLAGVKLMEVETTGDVDISGLKSGMYLAGINGKIFVKFTKE